MISSTATNEIIPALVAALGEMEDITKTRTAKIPTKTGPGYQYTFADLSDVLGYLRPKLAAHGLAVMQEPFTDDKGTAVATTIMHSSGQWIESRPLRLQTGSDSQSHGSAISYARRYQLLAQLGLATEDDDGATAKPAPPPPPPPDRPDSGNYSKKSGGPTAAMTKRAMAMFAEAGLTSRDDRLAFTSHVTGRQVGSWSDVTSTAEYDKITSVLDDVIQGRSSLTLPTIPTTSEGELAVVTP